MQVPGPFEYERATSVDHAIGLLDRLGEGARVVAGGHSLLPMMKLRLADGGQLKKYGSALLAALTVLLLIWVLRRRR